MYVLIYETGLETLRVHKSLFACTLWRCYLVHAKISYVCSSPVRGPYTLYMSDKIFKKRASKICAKQSLKNYI